MGSQSQPRVRTLQSVSSQASRGGAGPQPRGEDVSCGDPRRMI